MKEFHKVKDEKGQKRKPGTLGQTVNLVRMIAAIFVVSSVIVQFIYSKYLPEFINPYQIHWAINIIVALFFVSTYFIKYKSAGQLDYISISLYAVIMCYTMFLTFVNQLNPFATILLVLVMAGGTVIITNLVFYSIQSGIIFLALIIQFTNTVFSDTMIIGLFNIIVSVGLFGAVLFIRLRMAREVSFSNSLLKKIQLFSIIANPSGQIAFVSPSIKSILGYDNKSLLKEGWWENENLAQCWIAKDYILNYPAVIPTEIRSTESSVISSHGNEVWLSWTTSILPDGNYMGVALDVTKYKVS